MILLKNVKIYKLAMLICTKCTIFALQNIVECNINKIKKFLIKNLQNMDCMLLYTCIS